jgi:hypothetical protein
MTCKLFGKCNLLGTLYIVRRIEPEDIEPNCSFLEMKMKNGSHDPQQNDIQQNDTQHNHNQHKGS